MTFQPQNRCHPIRLSPATYVNTISTPFLSGVPLLPSPPALGFTRSVIFTLPSPPLLKFKPHRPRALQAAPSSRPQVSPLPLTTPGAHRPKPPSSLNPSNVRTPRAARLKLNLASTTGIATRVSARPTFNAQPAKICIMHQESNPPKIIQDHQTQKGRPTPRDGKIQHSSGLSNTRSQLQAQVSHQFKADAASRTPARPASVSHKDSAPRIRYHCRLTRTSIPRRNTARRD
ncbi:hypothetical protein B0H16DRAFT_747648 [Mycena metata]|uniref:Uncharacterized protein n=1 Tax=Mycena metata TaxID=1033252 RepID=A0AAD7J3W3_9AGAR|nr:hypothetical protein B0H16DRAFT_747648 [Mycena metata]